MTRAMRSAVFVSMLLLAPAGLLLAQSGSDKPTENGDTPKTSEKAPERSTGLPSKIAWTLNFDAGWGSFGFANSLYNISVVGERTYGSIPQAFGEDVSSFGLATYMKWFADADMKRGRDGLNVYNVRAYSAPLPQAPDLSFEFEYAAERAYQDEQELHPELQLLIS